MIEITTFGLMVLALIAGALARDYWLAKRDRSRAVHMDSIILEFADQPLAVLVSFLGNPYEVANGVSGRSLYIWKSPPNDRLPRGSGLLTMTATVEADGMISGIEWRAVKGT